MCDGDRVGAAVDAELGQDALDVTADSLRADDEGSRDLGLVGPLCEKPQDFALAQRQGGADRRRGVVSVRAVNDDPAQRSAHARKKLVGIEGLDDVVVCSNQKPGDPVG